MTMRVMGLSLLSFALAAFMISGGLAPAEAQGDLAAMKRDYRRPPPLPVPNPALAELGRGVTDARSRSDSGRPTSRKSQPLLGIGHAGKAPVGWDGRSPTLEAQA